jgi:hypothetical protein
LVLLTLWDLIFIFRAKKQQANTNTSGAVAAPSPHHHHHHERTPMLAAQQQQQQEQPQQQQSADGVVVVGVPVADVVPAADVTAVGPAVAASAVPVSADAEDDERLSEKRLSAGSSASPSKYFGHRFSPETSCFSAIARRFERGSFLHTWRGVLALFAFAIVLAVALIRNSSSMSAVLSFVLAILSLHATIYSFYVLRGVGTVATRVIVAVLMMTVYLSTRSVLILSQVQQELCPNAPNGATPDEQHAHLRSIFWQCTFLYNALDTGGLLMTLLVLP